LNSEFLHGEQETGAGEPNWTWYRFLVCSDSRNRLVRTRMLGGVGRAVSDDGPYPISSDFG